MQSGFVPLTSSMLSSELDFDYPRKSPFAPLSCNVTTVVRRVKKPAQDSKFSFDRLPASKRARCPSDPENVHPDDLEDLLLQPVGLQSPAREYRSQVPSSQSVFSDLDLGISFLPSSEPAATPNPLMDDIESLLFSDPLGAISTDPFFGAVTCFLPSRGAGGGGETENPSDFASGRRVVSVHDLANRTAPTPSKMQIKVLPNPAPFNTPTFNKKISTKAVESKDRAREERKEYDLFVKKLFANEEDHEEDGDGEDGEDDIFDLKALAAADTDSASGEPPIEDPRAIPSRELLELFAEEAQFFKAEDRPVKTIETPAKFDGEFEARLEGQLNLHFQLLVQNLALSGEIKDADQVWVTTLKLLIRINDSFKKHETAVGPNIKLPATQGLELLMRILKQSTLHGALLLKIQKSVNDPDLRIRASVRSVPFRPKFKNGKSPAFSKSFWHILSIFGEPFDPTYSLIPRNNDCPLTGSQIISESQFLQGKRNDSFLAIEDNLLLLGLHRYGLGNWEKIQSHLLPTRTAKQIATRYKNLTARRTPKNPIKDFAYEAMKPLSKIEEELLLQGVRNYGDDWNSISSRFLPHRPATVLQRLWLKHQSSRNTIADTYFPTEDEGDSDYDE